MYAGKFKGRQPETILANEWIQIWNYQVDGRANVWRDQS